MCFPGISDGKESARNAGDPSSIPRLGRSPGEGIGYPIQYSWVSLVAQTVKNLPAVQETWVWSLGWEDPLKGNLHKGSSGGSFVKNMPGVQETPETLVQFLGWEDSLEARMATWWENPVDKGAWQTTVRKVTKQLDATEHTHAHTQSPYDLLSLLFSEFRATHKTFCPFTALQIQK